MDIGGSTFVELREGEKVASSGHYFSFFLFLWRILIRQPISNWMIILAFYVKNIVYFFPIFTCIIMIKFF